MRTLLLISFLSLILTGLSAQHIIEVNHVRNGEDISKGVPVMTQYQFDNFTTGRIFFKSGAEIGASMNYNLLFGEIQFINSKKDTLLFSDHSTIDHIVINDHTFYYNPGVGHVELVADFAGTKLARYQAYSMVGSDRGFSDHYYSAAVASGPKISVANYSTGEFQWLNNKSGLSLKYKTKYYLRDYNGIFHIANKSSLMKIHARELGRLITYMREHNIDFSNEEQLKEVLYFCQNL